MASTPHPAAGGERLYRIAFVALLVLQCVPLWIFSYAPSQDGPSHLHNAHVLAHYGAEPIYQQYYQMTLTPAGNMLTQFLLAGFMQLASPVAAGKLLLTLYVLLLFVSFRYLLRALTPFAESFSLFAGILAPNWFQFVGFWNFLFSIPLLLFLAGYVHRRIQTKWTIGGLAVLCASSLTLYLTHALSWGLCGLVIGVFAAGRAVAAWPDRAAAGARLLEGVKAICAYLPPALLVLAHITRPGASACVSAPQTLRERLWPLYNLSILHTVGPADFTLARAVVLLLVAVAVFVLWYGYTRRCFAPEGVPVLVISLLCTGLAVFGPDCIGEGLFIHRRVELYVWVFFVLGLATGLRRWPEWGLRGVAAGFFLITAITFAIHIPALSFWNDQLSELVSVGRSIPPGSTVLALRTDPPGGNFDPLRHAAGLLADKPIILLKNYEAATSLFLTYFRADHSPFPALATLAQLESSTPEFDVARYEQQTRGRVDYVLLTGDDAPAVRAQLAGFSRIASSPNHRIHLYQRLRAHLEQ